jgi:phage terminase small subunit
MKKIKQQPKPISGSLTKNEDGLNPRQAAFVQEYLIDLNATQAAIRAGYKCSTVSSATARGCLLLANINISRAVMAAKAERSERTHITQDFVIDRLLEILDRCMQKAPVMVRSGRKFVQKKDSKGKDVWQFDSTGANRAAELLGKHVGLFEADNKQRAAQINFNMLKFQIDAAAD